MFLTKKQNGCPTGNTFTHKTANTFGDENSSAVIQVKEVCKTYKYPASVFKKNVFTKNKRMFCFKEPDYSVISFNALKNVSFSVFKKDLLLVAGANGSGKTLLMSIIASLISPDSGEVICKESCGLIFQNAENQILGETPFEDIMIGLKNIKVPINEAELIADCVLDKTGLLDKKLYPSRFLSGGEKKRLSIASMLAIEFPILIFDEPYANLDYPSICKVNKIIMELKNEGFTILILSHELEKCYALANRVLILNKGSVMFDGTPEDGLKAPLEMWGIKNPLTQYTKKDELLWI